MEQEEKTTSIEEKKTGIRGILIPALITAGFTFLGTLVGVLGKGCSDLRLQVQKTTAEQKIEQLKAGESRDAEKQRSEKELELERRKAEEEQLLARQKFDAELVKMAIASNDEKERIRYLEFMVKTHLILDRDIRDGVENYVREIHANPNEHVPQFVPTGQIIGAPDTFIGPLFVGTIYEGETPQVRRDVLIAAQIELEKRGYYRGGVDGFPGPTTFDAILQLQRVAGLPMSRRLDTETLKELKLLPEQRNATPTPTPPSGAPGAPIQK